tara:strand:- start:35017 stop:35988 length:972 start_codon:yes stop_codon:yes gene_type:complete
MPARHANTSDYRYGFQGQELDNELKGEGNSLNYKYRMHDPRVGRFFAVDPLTAKYPHYSPYSFSGNKVIAYKELEGKEEMHYVLTFLENEEPVLTLKKKTDRWWMFDNIHIDVPELGIDYTFTRIADARNFWDDFKEFKSNPLEAIFSGKFKTDEEILDPSEAAFDLAVTLLMRYANKVQQNSYKKSLGLTSNKSNSKMPAWLVRIREGVAFQQQKLAKLKADGTDYKGNIRLVPKNGKGKVKGNQTDADALIKNEDGTFTIIEYKLTSKTKLTTGQNNSKKHVEAKNSNQEFEVRSDIPEWNLKAGDKIKVKEYKVEFKEQG